MTDAASVLNILVDVRGRLDDLVKAQGEMRRLRVETAQTQQTLRTGFGGMFTNFFGAGLAVNAVSRSVSAGLNLITGSLREANSTFERSRNLDIGLEGYTKLRAVIRQAGGEVNSLDVAISNLNSKLADASEGDPESNRLLRSLGLGASDLLAMPTEERLLRLSRAAAQTADSTGQSWKNLGEILGGGRVMRNIRAGLDDLAENGFSGVASSATEAEARGTSAIHALFDSWEQGSATLKSKIVEDAGGLLSLLGYGDGTAPQSRQIGVADIQKLKSVEQQREALKALQLDLSNLAKQNEVIANDPSFTDGEKKFWANSATAETIKLLMLLEALREKMPLDKQSDDERKAELRGISLNIQGLTQGVRAPASLYRRTKEAYENVDVRPDSNQAGNPNFMSVREGLDAGAMSWITSLGSQGEQVAAMLQSTIGASVASISDGIYGWITGTQSFSGVLLNLGGAVLRTLIDYVIQMGVHWVISGGLAKATMTGIHVLGNLLRVKEVAAVNAAEAAKKPAIVSNAVAANAGSFGMSAVIGLAILTAIMAAFGGFATGGYTGNGPVDQVAGVVHGQEGVLNAAAMRRLGVDNLHALNAGRTISATDAPAVLNGEGGNALAAPRVYVLMDRAQFARAMQEDSRAWFQDMSATYSRKNS